MALMTAYLAADALIIIATMVASAYLFMTRKFKYWEKRNVTELPPTPFVGNFADCLLMKTTPSHFVKSLYDKCKGLPYMGFYIFDRPFFLARDPELVKHILVKDFQSFSDRFASCDEKDRLGYANLFMLRNPTWKTLRNKLSPIFTSGKLKKMFELMIEVADDLDDHLKSFDLTGSGKVFEMKDMCADFTTDLIATTAYGLKTNSVKNPNSDFRTNGRKIFQYSIWRSIELTSLFFMPPVAKAMGCTFFGQESSKYLRAVFWDTISRRMKSGEKRNDLVDLLIELRETYKDQDLDGFKFDGDDLVAQAAIFFTGGFETSSTALSFGFYELALEPQIQSTLRKEIHDALETTGGKITYDIIMNLPYMDMVVAEVLRKYPPLGFLDRMATTDYHVPNSNIILEKGTPIYISMLGMHHDPEFFPDPEKFDPERFNEENKRNRTGLVYFPFGEGPHICIGMRLGLMQTKLGLIQVLRNYEVLPSEKTVIPIKLDPKGLTTSPLGGVHLTLRKLDTPAG